MLTAPTRRDLQQLRFLLKEALARSQQQVEIDRRAAVLLLDGASKYAMALANGAGPPFCRAGEKDISTASLRLALAGATHDYAP